ncbi:MAG TPA: hypothetical protein VK518_01865 [Puia sp.]|nr:hypothetical protein [Puia sp.]
MRSSVLVIKKYPAANPLFPKNQHCISPGKKEIIVEKDMAMNYSVDKYPRKQRGQVDSESIRLSKIGLMACIMLAPIARIENKEGVFQDRDLKVC